MNINFSKEYLLRLLVHFLIMIFIAKAISLSIWHFLPKEGVQNSIDEHFVMPYMRYKVDVFQLNRSKIDIVDGSEPLSIDSIVLKAIYMMEDESLIVVAPKNKKSNSKTLALGEKFQGYKLEKVFNDYVLFSKSAKQYSLYLIKPKANTRWKNVQNNNFQTEPIRRISSVEVKKAVMNPTEIWKNIGLKEHSIKGIQDGFKVSFIRKGTIFESLGLKVGDVIQSINNKDVKNNAQAFGAYKEFKEAKALNIRVLRGKDIMELEYEIF